jgi:hypothetical protein
MKKWRVWFDQVNQTVYEVDAESREDAIKKAERIWKGENFPPVGAYTEEDGKEVSE